jgi:hypothetical protein
MVARPAPSTMSVAEVVAAFGGTVVGHSPKHADHLPGCFGQLRRT